jgi:hypothetical protein
MPFYRKKTINEIKEDLRVEIEKEVRDKYSKHLLDFEKNYLKQLKEQAEEHRKDKIKQMEISKESKRQEIEYLMNLHEKDLEKLNQDCTKKVEEYIEKEKELKRTVKDAQKAWGKIMEVHPQILSLLSMLRAKSETNTREAAREQAEYNTMLNESEIIDRKLNKLEPILEKLLHLNSPLLKEENEVEPIVVLEMPSFPENIYSKEKLK